MEHDQGPAGRAYRRRVGIVVWLVGDAVTAIVGVAWISGGGAPRLLVGLAVTLWITGLVMAFSGHNPLLRAGWVPRIPLLHLARRVSAGGAREPVAAARPDAAAVVATAGGDAVGDRPSIVGGAVQDAVGPWRRPSADCPACGAGAIWDGTVGPLSVDEPGPTMGYRCVCGNRFDAVDAAGFDALRRALLEAPLRWRHLPGEQGERRWVTTWDGVEPILELGDFPAESLYRLRLGGVLVARVDDLPPNWSHPNR